MKSSEYELLQRIEDLFGKATPDILVGIGDDAAVVRQATSPIILTTDSVVEGVHFQRSYFDPLSIGFKAVSAAVSDVAAMAGVPRYCLLSIEIPSDAGAEYVLEICSGAGQSAESYGAQVVGGNLSGTGGPLAITVCVVGFSGDHGPVARSGATPGDIIMLTGDIGSSQAGRLLMEEDSTSGRDGNELAERHLRPRARVSEALAIRRAIEPTSMIDISDGLAIDLCRLCRAGSTGATIHESCLPILEDTLEAFGKLGKDPVVSSISAGEDFELLFTANESDEDKAVAALDDLGVDVTTIGRIESGGDVRLKRIDDSEVELTGLGFDHFK